MRSLNPTLLSAMDSGNYDPYFLVTISDNYDGKVLLAAQPTGYELDDLEFSCTVQMPHFMDLPFYRTSVVLTRGVTIGGINYTLSTSKFCIISSTWDGNFQTFKCHLIPRVYYNAAGDLTYSQVITAFCAKFGKTAVFLDPAAAWLGWQFLPAGRSLTLNNAQTLFQQLKQKYFIFACDNGSDQILFYTGFTHVTAPQYQVTGYRFDLDYNVDQRRQYIWRDENETTHKTVPSFAQASALTGLVQVVMCMCDLGAGVVLAGNSKNAVGAGKIYRSTDYGLTWDSGYATGYAGIYSLLSLGNGIVLAAGYYGGFILRSTDYGVTWTEVKHIGVDYTISLCDCGNGIVLCGHTDPTGAPACQVWRSVDYGLNWVQVQQLGTEASINAILYVGNGVCLAGTASAAAGKIYRSTDYGASWTYQATLGTELAVWSLLTLGNGIVLAGTNPAARIYKSIDAGLTWSLVYTSTGDYFIYTLNTLGSGVVLAGTGQSSKVLRSVDYGDTWTLIQSLGTENTIRSFITLGNGSTLAGTGEHAQIWKSLNCAADLEMIHNLGFLPSTAVEPSAYFLLAQPKFEPFPVHLKYQSSDYIRVNLTQGGIYDFFCAQVSEILDLSQKRLPYRMLITQTPWLSGTAVGPLPSTIERVASYTPLVTSNFDDILTVYDNNLQAAMDRLDDHTHGAQLYDLTEKAVPEDADLFALVDSDTLTHLTRKISWADLKVWFSGGGPWGDGSDGDVSIGVDTTLSRDMQYNNLTVLTGIKLNTNGYIVRVKGILWNKGYIQCNGGDGGNAAGGGGGAVGAAATTVLSHYSKSATGGIGATDSAGTGNGAAGTATSPVLSNAIGEVHLQAGGGGGGGGSHGAGPVAGGASQAVLSGSKGGAGGAGTGSTSVALGGGGGGGGGGVVEVWAAIINNPGSILSNGGKGGNGAVSGVTKGGNGGGGAGGGVSVYYHAVTDSGLGTVQANGGAAGTAGNGGSVGSAGLVVSMQI